MSFEEKKLVLLAVDLAGYSRAVASLSSLEVAEFLDAWYRQCAERVVEHGGRVVKFIGDACLATFPESGSVAAVECATRIGAAIEPIRLAHRLRIDVGANVHMAIVAEGLFGPDADKRYDVLGSGVNHLFMMGSAAGLRISEPVYRQLPNEKRAPWKKSQPPATYSFVTE